MAQRGGISPLVIKRLPRYYRFLEELKSDGVNRISSGELARRMGLTASQIRQDLNCFGGFGQQGFGYSVEELKNSIAEILGLNEHRKTVLIGAGNLGRAIATHMQFERFGFRLIGVFDKKESLAGQIIKDMPIRHIAGLENFCRDNHPTAAILCIPKAEAEQLTKQLTNAEEELKQPFLQEQELSDKSARLAELDALLNVGNDAPIIEGEAEELEEEPEDALIQSDDELER